MLRGFVLIPVRVTLDTVTLVRKTVDAAADAAWQHYATKVLPQQ